MTNLQYFTVTKIRQIYLLVSERYFYEEKSPLHACEAMYHKFLGLAISNSCENRLKVGFSDCTPIQQPQDQ